MNRIFCLFLFTCSYLCCASGPIENSSFPKVVVFDFGGVVAKVDRDPLLRFLSKSLDISYSKIRKDFSSDRLYQALKEPCSYWEKYAGKKLSRDWEVELENVKKRVIQKIPGMEELILALKEKGIQVALLSNTKADRARFIERQGGYDHFDPILLSCHLGMKKPDPQIYQKLLTYLQWAPGQCLFLDDVEKNVEAARRLGINGIVFHSVEELQERLDQMRIGL